MSLNARLSKVSSAPTLFSFRFSSSSWRSFFASLTSMPPYFAFQRYDVCSAIPLPAQLDRLYSVIGLLQNRNDLLFAVARPAHFRSPFLPGEPTFYVDQLTGYRLNTMNTPNFESDECPQKAMYACSIGTQPVIPAVYGVNAPL